MNVEVVGSGLNMDRGEFEGDDVVVDSFGDLEIERLNIVFGDEGSYRKIRKGEVEGVEGIGCVMVDSEWLMIFEKYEKFREE